MEAPEEAAAGIDPGDKTETVVVKFLPCISKLDDGSEAEITGNLLIHLKIEAEEITVQKFIEVLGEKIAWGSGQEVELSCYDEKGNYERITTNPQLVGAIEEGRTGNDPSEVAIFAELIDASEDSVVGFVPSKAAESINDEAFLSTSDPVLNVADLGQNQMPTPSDLNLQGEGPFVDWSKVYIPEATGFAPEVIDEVEMCKLMGIPVDEDEEELSPVPPSQPAQPAPRASDHDEVTRLFKDAANDVDDENDEEICCVYDKEHPIFEVGRMWPNMKELKMSFKTYAVNKGFVFRTAWTDKYRYCVKCKGVDGNMEPCPWYMSARRLPGGAAAVRVNRMPCEHTCMTAARRVTRMTSQAWVEEKAMKTLSTAPNTTAKRLKNELERDYKCTLSYSTVWKGKQRAMKALYGDWGNTFRMLYNFKAEMELRSPGSIVEIDTVVQDDGKVYFSRFFMAMKACVDGFREGCRPYLSVVATALNGKWNGQLVSAVALDGHNWMFPVAVGLFQTETEADWTWFLSQLRRAIGPMYPLAICTDACKGLENPVHKVFPHVEQRECFSHLWLNLIKKFAGDVFGRMWPAARAYNKQTYKYHMDKMFAECPDFGVYLRTYHSLLWYRSGFNTDIKVDLINNHLAEWFNNWIRDIKDLPVHELMDTLRIRIMNLFNTRRALSNKLHGDKLPTVVQQVVCRSRGLGHLHVVNVSNYSAEVMDTDKKRRHVVKIDIHECTCLQWQATGKPCEHAIVVLTGKAPLMMGEYLHPYYSVDRFKAAYAGVVEPLTDQSQWPEVDIEVDLCAPMLARKAGRPKQVHFKSVLERGGKQGPKSQMKGGEVKGKDSNHRCKRCQELGHCAGSVFCVFAPEKLKRLTPECPDNSLCEFFDRAFSKSSCVYIVHRVHGKKKAEVPQASGEPQGPQATEETQAIEETQATELEPDGEGTPQPSPLPVPKLMKRGGASAIPCSPKRPKKDPYGKDFKRFNDHVISEEKSEASCNVSVGNDIDAIMQEVVKCGAPETSDEYYIATKLFGKLENRCFFYAMKTSEGRLQWLKRQYADRKRH